MSGTITWIGVRPERKAPVESVSRVRAEAGKGLAGDHATKEHRQITLIFQEALDQAAGMLGKDHLDPAATRRNVLISGMTSNPAEGDRLRIGSIVVEVTGPCLPCERMDGTLGDGGRMALAKAVAGGVTGRILESGEIAVGDAVEAV